MHNAQMQTVVNLSMLCSDSQHSPPSMYKAARRTMYGILYVSICVPFKSNRNPTGHRLPFAYQPLCFFHPLPRPFSMRFDCRSPYLRLVYDSVCSSLIRLWTIWPGRYCFSRVRVVSCRCRGASTRVPICTSALGNMAQSCSRSGAGTRD